MLTKQIYADKKVYIIDCRYFYEFEGGHIKEAINITNPFKIEDEFFKEIEIPKNQRDDIIIIFHCEFSQKRGPKMYRYFRKKDREIHQNLYPFIKYPNIYLLEGGFSRFVKFSPVKN